MNTNSKERLQSMGQRGEASSALLQVTALGRSQPVVQLAHKQTREQPSAIALCRPGHLRLPVPCRDTSARCKWPADQSSKVNRKKEGGLGIENKKSNQTSADGSRVADSTKWHPCGFTTPREGAWAPFAAGN